MARDSIMPPEERSVFLEKTRYNQLLINKRNFNRALDAYTKMAEDYPEEYVGWWGKLRAETKDFSDYDASEVFSDDYQKALGMAPAGLKNSIRLKYTGWRKRIDGYKRKDELLTLVKQQVLVIEEGESSKSKIQKRLIPLILPVILSVVLIVAGISLLLYCYMNPIYFFLQKIAVSVTLLSVAIMMIMIDRMNRIIEEINEVTLELNPVYESKDRYQHEIDEIDFSLRKIQ